MHILLLRLKYRHRYELKFFGTGLLADCQRELSTLSILLFLISRHIESRNSLGEAELKGVLVSLKNL